MRLALLTTLALISALVAAPTSSPAAAEHPGGQARHVAAQEARQVGPSDLATSPAGFAAASSAAPADRTSQQMITVSATSASATTATLTAWQKNSFGQWKSVLGPVSAWVGSGGIGSASEGSTRTPKGTWSLAQAFGRQADPGTALPYFRTDALDWWNGDVNSPKYNTHVRQSTNPGGASENLYHAGAVYNYAVVIGYNLQRTPGAGSAFFLHVSGGEPTAGCVSIPSASLVGLLKWLKPSSAPVIRIGIGVGKPQDDPVTEGSYIRSTSTNKVYRIIGGAPVHVSTWSALGTTTRPTRLLTPTQIRALPQYPKDGTYVRLHSSGSVYRIVGGAPLFVSTWAAVGGRQKTIYIDPAAITRAGSGAEWNHLRQYPANGTTLRVGSSTLYRVAGGAPIYVSSTANVPADIRPVTIDKAAVSNGGKGGRWNHLRQVPRSGSFIIGYTTKKVYRVVDGVPKRITSWAPYGGMQPHTYVDQVAISRHGQSGLWRHLL
ncbi:hypothetical protein D1871_02335 [Nakamurella silvestris]|nr:hypothetical protein D1871_02335 [Nakamurella silvestris]